MKKAISFILVLALTGLAYGCAYNARGAPAGSNFWRGGVIGGEFRAVAGATPDDISKRSLQEAAASGNPVEYTTEDGGSVFRADPLSYDEKTKCTTIRERAWENKKLVKDQTKDMCEGTARNVSYPQ